MRRFMISKQKNIFCCHQISLQLLKLKVITPKELRFTFFVISGNGYVHF